MIGLLILFVVCVVVWVVSWLIHKNAIFCGFGIGSEEVLLYTITTAIISALIVGGLALPIMGITGGLYRGYSSGVREGYIIKISQKGMIWKTVEGELQLGTGNQASLQKPFKFSVADKNVEEKISNSMGKRVKVKYIQWLIQPFKRGSSGYEITEIENVEQEK